jgi:HPt (histidine-containing phosphotransfer) domain-containing protein
VSEDSAVAGLDQRALQTLQDTVGDPAFVGELVGDFLGGAPAQISALRGAVEHGDAGELRRVAHTMKGNAATFGASSLADACRDLEHAADGEPEPWPGLLAAVEVELERAKPALEVVAGAGAS